MSKKIKDVKEFVTVLENMIKFLDSNSMMIKIKNNSISQLSNNKTFYYEFKSDIPDVTTWNANNLLYVIKTLTTKSADKVIYPTIAIDDDFIYITTIDDGMKIPLADDSMIEHEGDYSDIYNINKTIDLSKVIERITKLSNIVETDTIRLNINDNDIIQSIESTNDMTKASYKKVLNKSNNTNIQTFDFSKDFFIVLNGLKNKYTTYIDIDREDTDDVVCTLISKIPIIEDTTNTEILSDLYVFIENEEKII